MSAQQLGFGFDESASDYEEGPASDASQDPVAGPLACAYASPKKNDLSLESDRKSLVK